MSVMVRPYLDGGDAKEKEVRFRFQHVPFPCGKFLPFHTVCPEYEQTGTESAEKLSVQNPDLDVEVNGKNIFYETPNVVIYGYSGTSAEKYAKNNNISFVELNSNNSTDETINWQQLYA